MDTLRAASNAQKSRARTFVISNECFRCAGTADFLIAAMHYMLTATVDEYERKNIRHRQLHELEIKPYMFTIATTNMDFHLISWQLHSTL